MLRTVFAPVSIRQTLLLSFCILLGAPSMSAAQKVSKDQVLDYREQIRNDNDLPGLSVAVAVNGESVFSEGVGYAELVCVGVGGCG